MSFRSFQTGDTGAFHLTEIPEILLENQMEHVNFWNAVSKISDNLSRLSTNFTSIKTFPNQVSACFPVFDEQNRHRNQNGGFSTVSVPRVWIYFAVAFHWTFWKRKLGFLYKWKAPNVCDLINYSLANSRKKRGH